MAAQDSNNSVVFGKAGQNPPAQQTTQQASQRLTLQDLYGTSTGQTPPAQIQQSAAQTSHAATPASTEPPPIQTRPPTQVPPQAIPQQPAGNPEQKTIPPEEQEGGLPPIQQDIPAIPQATTPFPPQSFLRRKIKFIIGGVILLILLIITGFLTSRSTVGPTQNVKITYWGLWEEPKTMRPIIADFQKEHPNITIIYKKQDLKKYKDRVLTRISNNTGTDVPDIFTYHNTWLSTMNHILAPLPNSVISANDFKKNYFGVVQKDLTASGAIYGIPQGIDTLSLFINKEIFDAEGYNVPQTWSEFQEAAVGLTAPNESGKIMIAGAALGTYDNVTHAPDIISMMMMQNKVDVGNIYEYSNKVAGSLAFYTWYVTSERVWDQTLNPSIIAFANGELAMYFGYSWDIFTIKALNPKLPFEIHPVPYIKPEDKATIASYWVSGVSNKSPHQQEAMLFMQYLAKKEVAQKIYTESAKTRLFGMPYARTDLMKSLQSNSLIYPFVSQAEYASSSYFASDTQDTGYNEKLNVYLGNAIRSITNGTSPETATDTLLQGVAQVHSQ